MRKTLGTLLLLSGLMLAQNNATMTPFTGKIQKLEVQKPQLDPAYSLPIDPKSKFTCEATLKNGKTALFASVKSMMMVNLHQDYFIRNKLVEDHLDKLYVRDYLSGEKIPAEKAVYVFGSRLVGPHGDDLIPLSSEEKAKLFELKYGGHAILPYSRIDKGLIRYLDM